jgi:hypothetical protein
LDSCLRAPQESGADLHGAGAERKRSGDASAVGNSACCYNGQLHCVNDCRQQCD